jgi:hypothetical protein
MLLSQPWCIVYYGDHDNLNRVLSIEDEWLSHPDDPDCLPEPVAWLGGDRVNTCVALWASVTDEFKVFTYWHNWPKD